MGKPGRPSPDLDEYLYWQERLASREASGLSIDEFCADEDDSRILSNASMPGFGVVRMIWA